MRFPWKRFATTTGLAVLLIAAGPVPSITDLEQALEQVRRQSQEMKLIRAKLEEQLSQCRIIPEPHPLVAKLCRDIAGFLEEAMTWQATVCEKRLVECHEVGGREVPK